MTMTRRFMGHRVRRNLHSAARIEWLEGRIVPALAFYGPALYDVPSEYAPDLDTADLDGDGDIDLTLAGPVSGVMLNEGNGVFAEAVPLPGGRSSWRITSEDLDADGDADILALGNNWLSVYRNLGAGSFEIVATYSTLSGQVFAVSDFDGDGLPDVAGWTGSEQGDVVRVLRNVGDARFEAAGDYPVGDSVESIVASTFDDRAGIDILVTYSAGSVLGTLLRSNGDGTFDGGVPVLPGLEGMQALQAGDLDNDGISDLVFLNKFGVTNYLVAHGIGDGTFSDPAAYRRDGRVDVIRLADLNADGHLDLMAIDGTHLELTILPNDGLGRLGVGGPIYSLAPSSGPYGGGVPVSADFDGDGEVDVALAGRTLTVILRDGPRGDFRAPLKYAEDQFRTNSVRGTGDLDGDGHADLVMVDASTRAGSEDRVSVRFGLGDGTFGPVVAVGDSLTSPIQLVVGDFDLDGRPDIVTFSKASPTSHWLSIYRNAGGRSFLSPDRLAVDSDYAGRIVAADFDGDGWDDVVVASGSTSSPSDKGLHFFRNRSGLFEALPGALQIDRSVPFVNARDLNGDGRADLATIDIQGESAVWLGGSDFTFERGPGLPFNHENWGDIAAGDLDGDGDCDLVFAEYSPSVASHSEVNLVVLQNNSAGEFAVAQRLPLGGPVGPIGLADYDGDGRIDIHVLYGGEHLDRYRGLGDGTFQVESRISSQGVGGTLVVADFNGDGRDDLATSPTFNHRGLLTILLSDMGGTKPETRVGDTEIVEGDDGVTEAIFTITLSQPSSLGITLAYEIADGTAKIGDGDYEWQTWWTPVIVRFAPGQTTRTIRIKVIGDRIFEADERFSLDLVASINATIVDARAEATIINNDEGQPGQLRFKAPTYEFREVAGTAAIRVIREGGADGTISASFAVIGGDATAGVDYILGSGMIAFGPGEVVKEILVALRNDNRSESPETIVLRLSDPAGASSSLGNPAETTLTILDDDRPGLTGRTDYDGDGVADSAVFEPSTSTFYLSLSSRGNQAVQFGIGRLYGGDPVPVPADYDGDGVTDPAVFEPSTSTFYIACSKLGNVVQQFGIGRGFGGDPSPAVGDYDGDGLIDPAVFEPSTAIFYLSRSKLGNVAQQFGIGALYGGRPMAVPGDYDGDGKTDPAVFEPSTSTFYLARSSAGNRAQQFGIGALYGGDPVPVPADFDGDGRSDPAVFEPSTATFYLSRSKLGNTPVQFGIGRLYGGDPVPVPADFDGDGRSDPAVFEPSTATFYLARSSAGNVARQFGIGTLYGGRPTVVLADYDGDGRVDPSVFEPSTAMFYLARSSAGNVAKQFGIGAIDGGEPIALPTPSNLPLGRSRRR
jgi:hypothetical protein